MYDESKLLNILNIPVINSNRRYWLVRTDGGNLWEQFKSENFIAIGWNELNDIEKFRKLSIDPSIEEEFKRIIKNNFDTPQPGKIINTIRRFLFDIKEGDIVMIPSEGSNIITFGEICSDFYIYTPTEQDIDEERCLFHKRRNFTFLKDVNRNDLDPLLFKMFQAHQTISNADNYASVIDRTLNSLYVKNNKYHLKINVLVPNDVKAKQLLSLQNLILDCKQYPVSDDLIMKISIQSHGFIELIANNLIEIMTTLAILQIAIGGGKIGDYEIPGILSFINNLRNTKLERDKFELEKEKFELEKNKEIYNQIKDLYGDSLKDLNIETPNEILSTIVEINKNLNPEITSTEDDN